MSTISFGGLATGIDSNTIVDKLVALEKIPATKLQSRQAAADKRIALLSDLSTKLTALGTAAKAIDTPAELRAVKASTSDAAVSATATAAATPGRWAVAVTALARGETSRSQAYAARDAGVAGVGSLTVQVGADAAVAIAYTGADSLDDIAARINASGAAVTASVFHDGTAYRLAVASQATGAGAAITFTEAGAGLGLTEVQAARDAAFTVDGVPVTRASNHVDDVIPGVTFDLAAATSGTTVTVDRDADGQRTRVQALVDAYNAVARVVATQLAYDGTQKGEDTLFGDPTVRALQRGLASMITGVFPSGTSQVAARDVGITIGADGTLTLDAAKLDAAVAADPGKVEDLFGTGGLAGKVDAMVTQMTQSGTGLLVIQQDSLRTRNRSWDDQITRIESAADALGERLRAQYSQLEQAVSAMQSNLSYLTTLFGS